MSAQKWKWTGHSEKVFAEYRDNTWQRAAAKREEDSANILQVKLTILYITENVSV